MNKTAGILVKQNLNYTVVQTPSPNLVAIKMRNVIIVCAYLSPNREVDMELHNLQNLLVGNNKVLLAGDFNCRIRGLTNLQWRPRDYGMEEFINIHGKKGIA